MNLLDLMVNSICLSSYVELKHCTIDHEYLQETTFPNVTKEYKKVSIHHEGNVSPVRYECLVKV